MTILEKSYSLTTAIAFYTWGADVLGYFFYPYCTKQVTLNSQKINETWKFQTTNDFAEKIFSHWFHVKSVDPEAL